MSQIAVSRRGFLGTLLASIAGTAFAKAPGKLLWAPAEDLALPAVSAQALLTLDMITMEAARRLANLVSLPVLKSDDGEGFSLGERGMSRQLSVDMTTPDEVFKDGLDPERYLDPAVYQLAQRIRHEKWRGYGELPLPMAIEHASRVTDPKGGVSVRGLMQYDLHRFDGPAYVLRLDVMGAA